MKACFYFHFRDKVISAKPKLHKNVESKVNHFSVQEVQKFKSLNSLSIEPFEVLSFISTAESDITPFSFLYLLN